MGDEICNTWLFRGQGFFVCLCPVLMLWMTIIRTHLLLSQENSYSGTIFFGSLWNILCNIIREVTASLRLLILPLNTHWPWGHLWINVSLVDFLLMRLIIITFTIMHLSWSTVSLNEIWSWTKTCLSLPQQKLVRNLFHLLPGLQQKEGRWWRLYYLHAPPDLLMTNGCMKEL